MPLKQKRAGLRTHINGIELPTGKDPESRRLRRLLRNRLTAQASRDRHNEAIENYRRQKMKKAEEIAMLERAIEKVRCSF